MTTTGSTLETTPRALTYLRGVVSNAEPDLPSYTAAGQAFERATRPGYFTWLEHIRPAAGCTRPVRLAGTVDTVEAATGRRLARLSTRDLPDGVLYKGCGNRRATVCPSCAVTYRRDAYQLLRAGLVGGKGIPATVAAHDAVFVTLTAPSFGTVHTRTVTRHTCTDRARCGCRAEPCHPRRDTGLCGHGQPAVCFTRHEPADPVLGQPLCLDCYQHDHQVVWNYYAGELWRRTKQAIERYLAIHARRRGIPAVLAYTPAGKPYRIPPVRVSHGKAAEFQARGAVHFHALLRLDGVDPDDPDAIVPPPPGISAVDLDNAVRHAVTHVAFTTPAHPDRPQGWRMRWGEQVDVRHIALTGRGEVSDEMVAGYLAKYATKSTEVTGHRSTRLTGDTIDEYADPDGGHVERLIDACWRLGRPLPTARACGSCGRTPPGVCRCSAPATAAVDTNASRPAAGSPYAGLRRWAHMLGFGGHFLTKARRYSVTFRYLRDTRITYRRTDGAGPAEPIRAGDHAEETILVVGTLTFAGAGWHTAGDALLANTAAALARERQRVGREELARPRIRHHPGRRHPAGRRLTPREGEAHLSIRSARTVAILARPAQ